MRLFGALMMIAGMVWLMVGCSGALAHLASEAVQSEAASGVALADSVTQAPGVSGPDGAPTRIKLMRMKLTAAEVKTIKPKSPSSF